MYVCYVCMLVSASLLLGLDLDFVWWKSSGTEGLGGVEGRSGGKADRGRHCCGLPYQAILSLRLGSGLVVIWSRPRSMFIL
ncbi:hypothetical protein F5884DRAFT_771428 [Xylogone sp. PMI_703]|nr:hypothetical protein F5884DRAFT_771428 [Xylogone sp. PMI_703]